MKKSLVLVPIAGAAALAVFYFAKASPDPPSSGKPTFGAPGTRSEVGAVPTFEERASGRVGRETTAPTASSEILHRLGAIHTPGDIVELENDLGRGVPRLSADEIERLRLLARSGSQLQRRVGLRILAESKDPDGKTFALLRESAYLGDSFLAHAALELFPRFARANPSASRDVDDFLLGFARSPADEEARSLALRSVRYDSLAETQRLGFLRFLSDGSEELRISAVHVLARSGTEEAIERMSSLFSEDSSARVRSQVIEALAERARHEKDGRARRLLASFQGTSPEIDSMIEEALRGPSD